MSSPAPTPARGEATVARYEELRHSVLAGVPGGGHYGAIVVVRAGLAAWLAHASASTAPVRSAAVSPGRPAAPRLGDEVHQSLVRLLASMALASHVECHP